MAYSNKPLSGQTDQELAEDTGTGMGGQGSIIESQRRLRVELVKQQTATNRLAGALVAFTVIQTILLVAQMFHSR